MEYCWARPRIWPEQAKGREADKRSDIWAFGAVLYEMVTGRRAFPGKSYASLLGAILAADPAPMTMKPFTPAWLERLVLRCLAKGPENRYYSMHDVVLDLRTPFMEMTTTSAKTNRWPLAVAAVMTGAALAVSLIHFRETSSFGRASGRACSASRPQAAAPPP